MDLLTHLRAFLAVAEEHSFTGGAAATAVAQPVLSRRVAALERELGGPLFDRVSRGVRLTSLGRAVLPHARDVVVRADHLLDAARSHVLSDVRAALPGYADPQVLARLRKRLSGLGISLALPELAAGAREEALARGVVQLALLPAPPDRADLLVPLGGASVPGRLRGRRLHLEQLRDSDDVPGAAPRLLIQPEDDVPHVRDHLTQVAHAAGLAADQVITGLPLSESWTAVHERGDVLVCAEPEARRQGLEFRPLAPAGVRGYRLKLAADHPGAAILLQDRATLLELLAEAVGGEVVEAGA
ncbi:LysR family transcriptional regulator [Pseudactinotalea suaedae]|uniref:LysR family transcriptional regulator n=1 Tax=Pseudactinotalea suaedae TaxID=1524924 RepID=UPI0012E0F76A|nr:LysR family transcriptional regulator [Pseudactinotalea suaedae]